MSLTGVEALCLCRLCLHAEMYTVQVLQVLTTDIDVYVNNRQRCQCLHDSEPIWLPCSQQTKGLTSEF